MTAAGEGGEGAKAVEAAGMTHRSGSLERMVRLGEFNK